MDGTDPRSFRDDSAPSEVRAGPREAQGVPPRLFSVPPGAPFLSTLVRRLLDGTLVPGWPVRGRDGRPDPLALADATIYVPTRRAARELRATLVTEMASGGVATASFLPTIRALGDVEDEAGWFEEAHPESLLLDPVIDPTVRTIALARLTLAWIRQLPEHLAGLHDGAAIEVPSSPADAVWLARDLEALMDEVETQGAPWEALVDLDVGEHALWWGLTLQFLQIATEFWPASLRARSRSNPAAHRNAVLRAEARRMREGGARGPVVVAASPNLGPALTELIDAVARLRVGGREMGAVVLPGLDRALGEDEFRAVAHPPEGGEAEPGHPQSGLSRMLTALGVERAAVRRLDDRSGACVARERLVAEALRPSATTHRWVETLAELDPDDLDGALEDVELVEAPNPRAEALAIAVALRRGIEDGGTAALVTPDRGLARRVAAELRRFGIEADDSAGRPVLSTSEGALLRLAVAAAMTPNDPYALLGLLKHPLACFGLGRSLVRRATLLIELVALRSGGPPVPVDALHLAATFEDRLARIDGDGRVPRWRARFTDEHLAEARELMDRLRDALRPLAEARENGIGYPPSLWAGFLAHTLDTVGEAEDGTHDALYGTPGGKALARALRGLMTLPIDEELDGEGEGLDVRPLEMMACFEALLSGVAVRPPVSGHPRVAILGLIEARLLSPDTVVLGGLNEGAWPGAARTDQFLSRPMRETIRLEPPERRIGLEAHDFLMGMGAPRVVLTRARRDGGSPTVPSRWLQRLRAVLQEGNQEGGQEGGRENGRKGGAEDGPLWRAMLRRGDRLLDHAAALDAPLPDDPLGRLPRPAPTPPTAVRPTRHRVSEIEMLRRDPYAYYAKHVLELQPLPEPRAQPDARERGTLMHRIVERHVHEGDPAAPDAEARLTAIAEAEFGALRLPPDLRATWWAWFENMAPHYLAWERERAPGTARRLVELGGTASLPDGQVLSGVADRIDVMTDGRVEIVDYKTGTQPSASEARSLLSPQLPLEAAMAARGGFRALGTAHAASLLYVRLRPGDGASGFVAEPVQKRGKEDLGADVLGERAWAQLAALLARYRDASAPYRSRAIPQRLGDMDGPYDHLARAREWASGEDDEGDVEDGA